MARKPVRSRDGQTPVDDEGVSLSGVAIFTPGAGAYGAGDIMDASRKFMLLDRFGIECGGGHVRLLAAKLVINHTTLISGEAGYDLAFYTQNQPSGQADNDLWAGDVLDIDAYLGTVSLGIPVDKGGFLFTRQDFIDMVIPYPIGGIPSRLITAGGFTVGGTGRTRKVALYGELV